MTTTSTTPDGPGLDAHDTSADTGSPAPFDYRLPSLGADMDDGTIVEWRIAVGDEVHRGDVVAVVETDKSDIDIEIWHGGVVEELLVDVGARVDVGAPIARLRPTSADDTPDETVTDRTPEAPPEPPAPPPEPPAPPAAPSTMPAPSAPSPPSAPSAPSAPPDRVLASPHARRLAAQRGVDLAGVAGSGPNGAVVSIDVPDATSPPSPGPDRPSARTPERMRALIAERMARANREIPHYHLSRDVDLGAMTARLDELNAERPISSRLLPAAMYIRAVALAAAQHRAFNGFWIEDGFEPAEEINVAMAISLRSGGLVTPHIAGADHVSLDDTMATLTELVSAARRGTLRASWMTGATITITNLGDTGADLVHGVISPPQVALVGFGRVRQRPWVVDDEIASRPIATITLAADHRATDGAVGSRFLAAIASHLEEPEEL